MGKRFIKTLINLFGVVVLAMVLLFFARDFSRIINWSGSGFVLSAQTPFESYYAQGKDNQHPDYYKQHPIRFFWADPGDFISENIPATGDTILTIADSLATPLVWLNNLERPHEPGKQVQITYVHSGDTLQATFLTREVDPLTYGSVYLQLTLKLAIVLALFGVSFWAMYKRPDNAGVRALAMYGFTIAPFMSFAYLPMYAEIASFRIPLQQFMQYTLQVTGAFFSSFWLLLHMYFPRRVRLLDRARALPYLLSFGPQIIVITIITLVAPNVKIWFIVLMAVIFLQVLAGLVLLRHHFRTADSNIEKRQAKLVLYGSGAPLIIFCCYLLNHWGIFNYLILVELNPRLILINLVFLLLLASPISFAYAFGKYRLLEVEGRVRRSTRYVLATVLLLVFFVGAVYMVSEVVLKNLGVTSRTPTLLVAAGLALVFVPAQRKLQQQIERRFYPEKIKLRTMVYEFFRNAAAVPDTVSLSFRLEELLRESLGVPVVYTILRSRRNNHFERASGDPVPVGMDGPLATILKRKQHPLLLDEALASGQIPPEAREARWLRELKVALILPLQVRDQLVGFLGLGAKPDQEDYDPEELRALHTVTEQAGMALENLRLLEENVEKQRMEQELQIARQVQRGFLPQRIPATIGLTVKAMSSFSLEVAGDYYDVVVREDGSTLLAVGDVSGKGAPAALIMANLQASLRALCGVGLELRDMVSRINTIIHANTDAQQYITFFIGIFEPETRSFTYVNAGHNPPRRLSPGGRLATLEVGGLILGVEPAARYEQETLALEPGETLFLYTDGLNEAMDSREVEYGEERIDDRLLAWGAEAPERLLRLFLEDVDRYRGEMPLDDDLTLLIARVE